jgi:hypothetical protein
MQRIHQPVVFASLQTVEECFDVLSFIRGLLRDLNNDRLKVVVQIMNLQFVVGAVVRDTDREGTVVVDECGVLTIVEGHMTLSEVEIGLFTIDGAGDEVRLCDN